MVDYSEKLKNIRQELNVDFAAIAFPEDLFSGNAITWKYVSGNLNEKYKRIHLRRGKGVAGQVLKSGRSYIELDVKNSIIFQERFSFPIVNFEELTSIIALPLWKYNKAVGVMLIGNRNDKPLSVDNKERLETFIKKDFDPFYEKDEFNRDFN